MITLLISVVLLLTNLALALWVYNTIQEIKRLRKQVNLNEDDFRLLLIHLGLKIEIDYLKTSGRKYRAVKKINS